MKRLLKPDQKMLALRDKLKEGASGQPSRCGNLYGRYKDSMLDKAAGVGVLRTENEDVVLCVK
jgi:hypothetical protein